MFQSKRPASVEVLPRFACICGSVRPIDVWLKRPTDADAVDEDDVDEDDADVPAALLEAAPMAVSVALIDRRCELRVWEFVRRSCARVGARVLFVCVCVVSCGF